MWKSLVDAGLFDVATFLCLRIVEVLDEIPTEDDELPEDVRLALKVIVIHD